MRKELLVILVNKVVDSKRIIGKKWRAEEEESHKESLTQKRPKLNVSILGHPFIGHRKKRFNGGSLSQAVIMSAAAAVSARSGSAAFWPASPLST
jgi:hypothetical protein